MAKINNIKCYKGEDVVVTFTMSPVPGGGITGWTILFSLRRIKDATTTLLFSVGAAILSEPSGVYSITIPGGVADQGTNRTPNKYAYDVWRTNSGVEAVLSIGDFEILPEVRK